MTKHSWTFDFVGINFLFKLLLSNESKYLLLIILIVNCTSLYKLKMEQESNLKIDIFLMKILTTYTFSHKIKNSKDSLKLNYRIFGSLFFFLSFSLHHDTNRHNQFFYFFV